MTEAKAFDRSSDQVENKLVSAVLKGDFPPGSFLPPERELAARLGVARPTLREALRRLERDGWFTARKGQSTAVNDIWQHGNLNTLVNIVQNADRFPREFIVYLLEVRSALAPSFVRDAVERNPVRVVASLAESDELEDNPDAYASFDWKLQKKLARLSDNPVYLLILNSFDSIYFQLARAYFSKKEHRLASQKFYQRLLDASMASNHEEAAKITRETMEESIKLWKNNKNEG